MPPWMVNPIYLGPCFHLCATVHWDVALNTCVDWCTSGDSCLRIPAGSTRLSEARTRDSWTLTPCAHKYACIILYPALGWCSTSGDTRLSSLALDTCEYSHLTRTPLLSIRLRIVLTETPKILATSGTVNLSRNKKWICSGFTQKQGCPGRPTRHNL